MKTIPVSKIDALIASLEVGNNYCYECGIDYQEYTADTLRGLEKESEEMIPLSTVEARIKELQPMARWEKDISSTAAIKIDELKKLLPTADKKKELTKDKDTK